MPLFRNPTTKGLFLGIGGALVITPDALLLKVVEANLWQILFWRNLAVSAYFILFIAIFERVSVFSFLKSKGKEGLAIGGCFIIGNFSFILAILYNPAANVLVIISTSPLVTAVLSHLMLGEKIEKDTLATLLVCVGGMVILLWDDLTDFDSIFHILFILPLIVILPVQFVIIRVATRKRLFPCILYGALINTVAGFLMSDIGLPPKQIGILLFNGAVISALSFSMLFSAPKYIPATWTNMFLLLETVLGSYLVWFFVGEELTNYTLAGSAIVLLAMFFYFWRRLALPKS